jgi:hypothetical protein
VEGCEAEDMRGESRVRTALSAPRNSLFIPRAFFECLVKSGGRAETSGGGVGRAAFVDEETTPQGVHGVHARE